MSSDRSDKLSKSVAEWYHRLDDMKYFWWEHQRLFELGHNAESMCSRGATIFAEFEEKLLPGLQQVDLFDYLGFPEEPWLADFTSITGGFSQSLALYTTKPKEMLDQLRTLIKLSYCDAIHISSQKLDPTQYTRFQEVLQLAISTIPQLKCDEDEMREKRLESFAFFICALTQPPTDLEWINIGSRVKEFAEVVGYRKSSEIDAERNVFQYIDYLYHKALQSTNSQQISALEAKIAILTQEKEEYLERSRTQNRILVSLNIRHVLERLPPRLLKQEKANWESFWKVAVDKAIGNKSSPLSKLIDSYALHNDKNSNAPPNVENIKKTGGANLYGALSTNIHQFKGEYKLEKDQWNALDFDILQTLRPLPENGLSDGSINWEAERQRFIPCYKEVDSEEVEKTGEGVEKSGEEVKKNGEGVKKNGKRVEKSGEGIEKNSKGVEKSDEGVEKSNKR